jgi:hypothetical protein
MKTIFYKDLFKMPPKEGLSYSTTYVQQTRAQRDELCSHIKRCVEDLAYAIEGDEAWQHLATQRLRGFNRHRTIYTIISDILTEASGRKRDGSLKDFALAPIERWNRLFKNTDYEIELEPDYDTHQH